MVPNCITSLRTVVGFTRRFAPGFYESECSTSLLSDFDHKNPHVCSNTTLGLANVDTQNNHTMVVLLLFATVLNLSLLLSFIN